MNRQDVYIPIIAGTILFVLVSLFINVLVLLFKSRRKQHAKELLLLQQSFEKELLQSRIEVQEDTFQQIGKELHDNVGQLLSTSKMLLGLTEIKLENPPDTLLTANTTLSQAIQELRSLSKSLDKEWLELFRFTDNLQAEIRRINASNSIIVSHEGVNDIPCSPDEQIILFRIVQEAIQNAIKHAQPAAIVVRTNISDQKIRLVIADNGKGFNWSEKKEGMGLANMKFRTQLLGGTICWNPVPGTGTEVEIYLPIKKST